MSKLSEQLNERRKALSAQMVSLAENANKENRALNADEVSKFDGISTELEGLDQRLKAAIEGEQRAADIDAHFTDVRDPEQKRDIAESSFGKWARDSRAGAHFDVKAVAGAERRALNAFRENRAMSYGAGSGLGKDGVYGQLWEYAVAGSQILQAGVDIIQTADGNALPLPVVTAHATGASAAANANITASDAAMTVVDLTATKYGYITYVPSELLQDATFDLEGYLARAAGRELGKIISTVASTAAVAGFTVSGATAPSATVGATGSVFSDAVITLFHSVLPEYRASSAFLFSDPTAAGLRKTKDPSGRYIWETALTAGTPDLVLGKPTFIDSNLQGPSVGTAKIIYYGDWSALKVRIAGGLRFERSNDVAFASDQVAFRSIVRTGAVAVDTNAVKFLQLTAS